ncbi:MAG: hypothetical protein V4736_14565 [Bdellovibrionota bacterium]
MLNVACATKAPLATNDVIVSATAEPLPFNYPTTAQFEPGRAGIDADFLKQFQQELAAAKKTASRLFPSKRKSEVSRILQSKNKKQIAEVNKINAAPIVVAKSEDFVSAITKDQAELLHKLIQIHPITSESGTAKYDTKFRMIGYCFGRATYVHQELLRRGVDPASIAKMFALGGLYYKGAFWDFHVATLVKSTDGGWWAIDGLGTEVRKLDDWAKETLKLSMDPKNPTTRFYLSDAAKFHPTPGPYSEEKLYSKYYNGYFKDLSIWFQNNPLKPGESFKN